MVDTFRRVVPRPVAAALAVGFARLAVCDRG